MEGQVNQFDYQVFVNEEAIALEKQQEEMQAKQAELQKEVEKENTGNLITHLLLAVGSLFVTIAIVIFAYKAWPHLSEYMKNALLILATGALYVGSVAADRKLHIKGSSTALYYLGTLFTGICANTIIAKYLLVTSWGAYLTGASQLAVRVFFTFFALLVPMGYRTFQRRRAIDLIFSILCFDISTLVFPAMFVGFDYMCFAIVSCIIFASMVYLNYVIKQMPEEKHLILGMDVVMWIQSMSYLLFVVLPSCLLAAGYRDAERFVYLAIVLISLGVAYMDFRRKKGALNCTLVASFLFAAAVALAFVDLPFVKEYLEFEQAITCFVVMVFAYGKMLERYEEIQILKFIFLCITSLLVLSHDVNAGELPNVIFLGVTELIVLYVSIWKKNMKYSVLSAIVLVLLVIYVTREFWMSISWWVYLLVAGVAMIATAICRERKNQ